MRSRLCDWTKEMWGRHIRFRKLYRQLDQMRVDLRARTAWLDELSEEELAEMLCGLSDCIDALQEACSEAPDRSEGTQ